MTFVSTARLRMPWRKRVGACGVRREGGAGQRKRLGRVPDVQAGLDGPA
jgi:hypothetical protein